MSTTEIDLDALLSAGRDAIIRAFRGSTDEDWPSLVLQIPTLIAAIRERDAHIAALTATPPPTADLVALVREIAEDDPWIKDEYGNAWCRFCNPTDSGLMRWKHYEGCHWERARAIVRRLEGHEHGNT